MKTLSLLILFFISFSSVPSPLPDFPFVTVTGKSAIKVKPNTANLNFYVFVFDKNSESAKLSLDKTSLDVIELFTTFGVNPKKITLSEINKRTIRNRNNNYEALEVIGYEFTQHFAVAMDNLNNFSEIYSALLAINNIEELNSQFDISNRETVETELIKKAAESAKLKAIQMAAGLGVKIDSVFAFNDSGSFPSFFATFGLNEKALRAVAMQSPRASQSSGLFVPQFIEVSKTVNVVYKIEK